MTGSIAAPEREVGKAEISEGVAHIFRDNY
jgi:hypothetical protein